MILSLGEVEALVRKAAAGAGRAPGIADEAGRAVRWLAGQGQQGAPAMARLLLATDGVPHAALCPPPDWSSRGCPICPLILGTALSDARVMPPVRVGALREPMLLLPFLAGLAGDLGMALRLSGPGMGVEVSILGLGPIGDIPHLLDPADISRAVPHAHPGPLASRAEVDSESLEILSALAARTYAPATADSRTRGAGAGTGDGD